MGGKTVNSLGPAVLRIANDILEEWQEILDTTPDMAPDQRERIQAQVERLGRAIDGMRPL